MEFSFIWLARFSWPAQCSSVFTSVSSPFSPFLFVFVSLSQTSLYFFEVNYFLELWGLFRSTSQALHQHGQNLHIRFCWGTFLGKKLAIFEFELKPWQLLSLIRPFWTIVVPYVPYDLSGLPLILKVILVIFLLTVTIIIPFNRSTL